MNAGAAAARGTMLLFLHADTLLPRRYAREVRQLLTDPGAILAAFRLGIDHPGAVFRLIESAANLRSRRLSLPFGDQALAMRASDFHRLGGFADVPFMEDFEFACRARRAGRVVIARGHVRTSARRWVKRGAWRLTLIHQACIAAYRLGIAPQRIARWREYGPTAASAPERPACATDRAQFGDRFAEILPER